MCTQRVSMGYAERLRHLTQLGALPASRSPFMCPLSLFIGARRSAPETARTPPGHAATYGPYMRRGPPNPQAGPAWCVCWFGVRGRLIPDT
jgi:hypothetical protein